MFQQYMSEESRKLKTPEELGITIDQWSVLAESLLISWQMVEYLNRGSPLYELHNMQKNYLERYFGITQSPPILNPQETNHE